MPLSRNQKIGVAVAAGLALFAFAGAANAADVIPGDDDEPDDDACPPGTHAVPGLDGSSTCVPDVVPDPDDLDDPLPPPPPQCNYAGCGNQFDNSHSHPSVYALQLQELGYPINVVGIAANGSTIAVNPARGLVREFQRDYNAVKAGGGVAAINAGPTLGTDGLVGNMTIAAIKRAKDAVNLLNLPWVDIVELA